MRKIVFFVALISFFAQEMNAQSEAYRIDYKEVMDGEEATASLFVYNGESVFVVFDDKMRLNASPKIQKKHAFFGIYKNTEKGELYSKSLQKSKKWKVQDTYPKNNWKVSKEKKKIRDYSVLKATTTFRGREYLAWYHPNLGAAFGPYRLGDLPGVIMALHTTDGFLKLDFLQLKKSNRDEFLFWKTYMNEDIYAEIRLTGLKIQVRFPESLEKKFEWE